MWALSSRFEPGLRNSPGDWSEYGFAVHNIFSTWDKPILSETGPKIVLDCSYYFCLIDLNDAILAAEDSNSVQVDGNAI